MQDNLFESVAEPFQGPKPHSMPLFDYLLRSDRSRILALRSYWNRLFDGCTLSDTKKKDILQRFRNKSAAQHLGSMSELLVYQLFKRSGFTIESVERAIGQQPDFKVQSSTGAAFYLEATCILDRSASTSDQRFREAYEVIRSIESDKFRLCVSVRRRIRERIKSRYLRNQVKSWLASLDHTAVLAEPGSLTGRYDRSLDVGGGRLMLRPIAIDPPVSSRTHGLVMFAVPGEAELLITDRYIRTKLKDKAKQVRDLPLPVLLVVNVLAPMDRDDILNALFGRSGGAAGAWTDRGGKPVNRSIEAILFLCNVGHAAVPASEPIIVLNPFLEAPRIPVHLPFARYLLPSVDGLSLKAFAGTPGAAEDSAKRWREHWPLP